MTYPPIWRIPRESVEWVGPVTLTGTGVLELAVVLDNARPAAEDWVTPTVIETKPGVLVQGKAPGTYRLWARLTDTPEAPVFDSLAYIVIT